MPDLVQSWPFDTKKAQQKQDFLKVDIKTRLGEGNSKSFFLYVPIFETVLTEALLKFLMRIKKILKEWNLRTCTHRYVMTNNPPHKSFPSGLQTESAKIGL